MDPTTPTAQSTTPRRRKHAKNVNNDDGGASKMSTSKIREVIDSAIAEAGSRPPIDEGFETTLNPDLNFSLGEYEPVRKNARGHADTEAANVAPTAEGTRQRSGIELVDSPEDGEITSAPSSTEEVVYINSNDVSKAAKYVAVEKPPPPPTAGTAAATGGGGGVKKDEHFYHRISGENTYFQFLLKGTLAEKLAEQKDSMRRGYGHLQLARDKEFCERRFTESELAAAHREADRNVMLLRQYEEEAIARKRHKQTYALKQNGANHASRPPWTGPPINGPATSGDGPSAAAGPARVQPVVQGEAGQSQPGPPNPAKSSAAAEPHVGVGTVVETSLRHHHSSQRTQNNQNPASTQPSIHGKAHVSRPVQQQQPVNPGQCVPQQQGYHQQPRQPIQLGPGPTQSAVNPRELAAARIGVCTGADQMAPVQQPADHPPVAHQNQPANTESRQTQPAYQTWVNSGATDTRVSVPQAPQQPSYVDYRQPRPTYVPQQQMPQRAFEERRQPAQFLSNVPFRQGQPQVDQWQGQNSLNLQSLSEPLQDETFRQSGRIYGEQARGGQWQEMTYVYPPMPAVQEQLMGVMNPRPVPGVGSLQPGNFVSQSITAHQQFQQQQQQQQQQNQLRQQEAMQQEELRRFYQMPYQGPPPVRMVQTGAASGPRVNVDNERAEECDSDSSRSTPPRPEYTATAAEEYMLRQSRLNARKARLQLKSCQLEEKYSEALVAYHSERLLDAATDQARDAAVLRRLSFLDAQAGEMNPRQFQAIRAVSQNIAKESTRRLTGGFTKSRVPKKFTESYNRDDSDSDSESAESMDAREGDVDGADVSPERLESIILGARTAAEQRQARKAEERVHTTLASFEKLLKGRISREVLTETLMKRAVDSEWSKNIWKQVQELFSEKGEVVSGKPLGDIVTEFVDKAIRTMPRDIAEDTMRIHKYMISAKVPEIREVFMFDLEETMRMINSQGHLAMKEMIFAKVKAAYNSQNVRQQADGSAQCNLDPVPGSSRVPAAPSVAETAPAVTVQETAQANVDNSRQAAVLSYEQFPPKEFDYEQVIKELDRAIQKNTVRTASYLAAVERAKSYGCDVNIIIFHIGRQDYARLSYTRRGQEGKNTVFFILRKQELEKIRHDIEVEKNGQNGGTGDSLLNIEEGPVDWRYVSGKVVDRKILAVKRKVTDDTDGPVQKKPAVVLSERDCEKMVQGIKEVVKHVMKKNGYSRSVVPR